MGGPKSVVGFFHAGPIKPYIARMVRSVRDFCDKPIVYFTDSMTADIEGVDETVRTDYKDGWMISKLSHARDYECDELVLLDTDIVALKPFDDILEHQFDVAMYPRPGNDDRNKYNGGVVYCRNRQFWEDCVKEAEQMSPNARQFGCDQTAENRVIHSYQRFDLPQRYNYVPQIPSLAKEPPKDTVLMHFKGSGRKAWM